jgi:hypothetical protein
LATLEFNIQELESQEADLIKSRDSIRRGMISLANSITMNIDELQDTTENHPLTGDPAKAGYVWKLNLRYPEGRYDRAYDKALEKFTRDEEAYSNCCNII